MRAHLAALFQRWADALSPRLQVGSANVLRPSAACRADVAAGTPDNIRPGAIIDIDHMALMDTRPTTQVGIDAEERDAMKLNLLRNRDRERRAEYLKAILRQSGYEGEF